MQIGLGLCHIVLDGDPTATKRLDASRCHLVGRTGIGLCLGDIVLDKDAALPPPEKAHSQPPILGSCLLRNRRKTELPRAQALTWCELFKVFHCWLEDLMDASGI